GHKVAVIERGMIGGSCINIACIPTKTLIQNARIAHIRHQQDGARTDMAAVSQRVKAVVDAMVELNHDAFLKSGLELVLGTGRFVGPRRIEVKTNDGALRVIEGDHAYINTGTTAAIPDIPGLKAAEPLTHVEALVLTTLPEHLIVIGGGYI